MDRNCAPSRSVARALEVVELRLLVAARHQCPPADGSRRPHVPRAEPQVIPVDRAADDSRESAAPRCE